MISVVGGVDLDMTQAEFSAPEVTITRVALLGSLKVVVPRGTRVEVTGFKLLGGNDVKLPDSPAPDGPSVHLRVYALFGGVKVRSA